EGYDVFFSQLTEINGYYDVYPDILLGRCSVDSEEQVANVCQKIINYEPININDPEYDGWKDRMTFLAGEPQSSSIHDVLQLIAPLVEDYETTLLTDADHPFPDLNFDDIIQDNSVFMLKEKYGEGNLIITYMGHGGDFSWGWPHGSWLYSFGYSDISEPSDTLYDNRLPLIFSMACNTGAFQTADDCMAENFLISDSIRGAIGFIGASEPNVGCVRGVTPYLFKSAFQHGLGMCGEMMLEAKLNSSCADLRNQYNLFGDPSLNILLDSENITEGDLLCNQQQISVNNINNQTLQIVVGISNRSEVNITDNFDVICYLTDTFFETTDSLSQTINCINAMQTIGVDFDFDISNSMPTEFAIQIIVDPDNLIAERNEENNEAEIGYDFYRFLDGFPCIYYQEEPEWWMIVNKNIPLFDNNHIIINGKKISSSGDIILDSNLQTSGLSLPIYNSSNGYFDYIIRSQDLKYIYRIDGTNGDILDEYNNGDYEITNYCLGDINNDGEIELVCSLHRDPPRNKIVIFDLSDSSLNILYEGTGGISTHIVIDDLAIGDGDNDGKNEIYGIETFYRDKIRRYEFNNGNLTVSDQHEFSSDPLKIILEDFNYDGELDCVVFLEDTIYFLDCANFDNILYDVNLTSNLRRATLGDIDNDGITEILILESNGNIYKIDILDTDQEQFIFSVGDQPEPLYEHYDGIILYDLNSDIQLDVVLYDDENISGYILDGELIFAFPKNGDIYVPVISDIDNDSDIEIIFENNAPDFIDYSKLIVSDLTISISNHGNIYPRMNEFNNNLYTQPVTGTLLADTTYYWSGTITLHQDIILPESSILNILPGTVIKARENSKIIVYGNLVAEGFENNPIKFVPDIYGASNDYWQGIEIDSLGTAFIANCEIENADEAIHVNTNAELNITGNLNFSSNIYIASGGELSIADSVEIYGMTPSDSIKVYGNIAIGNNVKFTASEGTSWDGLHLLNTIAEVAMNNVTFENCKLYNESYLLNINNGTFINSGIEQKGLVLEVYYTDFDNSIISCDRSSGRSQPPEMPAHIEVDVNNCYFENCSDYAISITNYPLYELHNNAITNCEGGFIISNSGNPIKCIISDNNIHNNSWVGIWLHNSLAYICERNKIENNYVGIVALDNSLITITGNPDYPHSTIKDNMHQELIFDTSSFPTEISYNKVIDDAYTSGSNDQYLIRTIGSLFPVTFDIKDNYWGLGCEIWNEGDGDNRFHPEGWYDYLPIWIPGPPVDPRNLTEPEELYASADSLIQEEGYEQAKLVYKDIIELYPESKYAIYSMRNLLPLETVSGHDFSSLQQYYQTEPNCNYDSERSKLSSYLANYCKIKLENYPEAISFFEDIIENPDTELDSVYAVIDAGYTYLLMEDDSARASYIGRIAELKPKSVAEFEETRDRLLAKVLGLPDADEEEIIPENIFYLGQNYPNPMRTLTTISFSIPKDSENPEIRIYNIKGQLVKQLSIVNNQYSIEWDGKDNNGKPVANGIYLYKLSIDKSEDISSERKSIIKKMILLK
ncbi:MAG: T9SS type A sorting domain-containing protein, partial [Candidatus Cloacimonetes bacterium]|nr:T9SS type A sorting domain-containing protein [Candidatus Cloacimonadota bacterium]